MIDETPQQQPEQPAPTPTPAPVPQPQPAAPVPAPAQPTPAPVDAEQAEAAEKAKKKALKEKKKKKKLMITLILALMFFFVMVFGIAFMILSQAGGGASNPLLQLFGVSEAELYPFLINLANLFFGLFDFVAFLVAIIGVFMLGMAKKEDKKKKKSGMVMLVAGLLLFFMISMAWAGSYFYLQGKKAQYAQNAAGEVSYITTSPEDTGNLTAPALVEFDATGLPVDPNRFTIISYSWDFGDDTSATGPVVSHRYLSKGEEDGRYIVTLSVAYRDKKTSEEDTQEFTVDVVFVNEKVSAAFTADPERGSIPLEVNFDASDSMDPDGEIVEYEWDLDGDGQYDDGKGVSATYTYTKFGTYLVKLRVTDNNGETAIAEYDMVIDDGDLPRAEINVDLEDGDVLYANKEYIFKADNASSPNGKVIGYEWSFGDGSNVTKNKTASHSFNQAGDYTVSLTLKDDEGNEGTITLDLEVSIEASAPAPVISTDQDWADGAEGTIQGEVPFKVEFSAADSTDPDDDIVNMEWDLNGDGTIDEAGETIEYTYEEAGIFDAILYVEDAEGHEAQTSISVNVDAQNISAELTADTLNGETPLTVRLDASGSSYPDGNIVNYFWDFGNEVTRYDTAQVTYTFTEVGTHEVKVKAIASDGSEAEDSLFINVLPVSLTACFDSNVETGPAPLVVTFNPSCSSGTVSNYRWDFGDGDISFARKPTHTFQNPGTYTVTLTVDDPDGLSNTFTKTVSVLGAN